MPLYEYECESCANRFERIQKFSDPPADTCPKCSGPVRKLLSSPAIQFKGSGWYITDYAKKSGSDDKSKSASDDKSKPAAAAKDSAGESSGGSPAKASDSSTTTTKPD